MILDTVIYGPGEDGCYYVIADGVATRFARGQAGGVSVAVQGMGTIQFADGYPMYGTVGAMIEHRVEWWKEST